MYLNCKTYFSLRWGTLGTEALVEQASELGLTAMALTNINTTADAWDFTGFCRQAGIRPIIGAEIRNGHTYAHLLLAKNDMGLLAINRYLSEHLQTGTPFPARPELGEEVFVIYPLFSIPPQDLRPHEFIGVQPGQLNKLFRIDVKAHTGRFVIQQPVSFKDKIHFNLHRLLRAIDTNTLITRLDPAAMAAPTELFLSPHALLEAFSGYPDIVTNTLRLMDQCSTAMEFHTDKNKKTFSASLRDDKELLQKLATEGMYQRYGLVNAEAHRRVFKELEIIDRLGFNAYFLITWDLIRYAGMRNFMHVGRGSGANSIVAYCLGITDVNPIDLDLYFERFLNPYRSSPPDFDIDFSWQDRDEVIDYVFKRYGKEQVCLLGSYTTFQYRALVRELGKVFGLPKAEIDKLANSRDAEFKEDGIQRTIAQYGKLMLNIPNNQSIHPGGMLITERPVYQYTGVVMPPKGFLTSQIDMFVAEKVGLYKLDILSQRGLGHIRESVQLIRQNRGHHVDITEVEKFKTDPDVAEQIRKADTIGCFYIESPAMRQLLQKLRCDNYTTLVAASSIIRPGVAQSGMMREYVYRYRHPDKITYLHPKMEELLQETYGVMVYQEDVIKVAHHFAGLDMGEADILRRAMSGKYRGHKEMDRIRRQFFDNCKSFGYPQEISNEVWRQIESFGGYSFSKAHSASFAVESYQSLYLKTNYPLEFMVAVINNFGGFYSRELYFYELQKAGATLHAPCVNRSGYLTNISGRDVYVGFIHITGLDEKLARYIVEEREKNGDYTGLIDFLERTQPGVEQVNLLIRLNALRFTGRKKKELLWEANFIRRRSPKTVIAGKPLFQEEPQVFELPQLEQHPLEDAMDEYELLGFSLCSPFRLVDADPSRYLPAGEIGKHVGREVMLLGYLIATKDVRTRTGERMQFGTFIDARHDWMDTVHFPASLRRYPIEGRGFYQLRGKVMDEFGVYSVDTTWLKKVGIKTEVEVEAAGVEC